MRREELASLTADADLWNDPDKAQRLMSEKNTLEAKLGQYENFTQTLQDYKEMEELGEAENDENLLTELMENLQKMTLHVLLKNQQEQQIIGYIETLYKRKTTQEIQTFC